MRYNNYGHLTLTGGGKVDIACGINDTISFANIIKGGDVKFYNMCFGTTGVANRGTATRVTVPNNDTSKFWDIIFFNLSKKTTRGFPAYRTGFHDAQTTLEMLRADENVFLKELRRMLKCAESHSVKVIFTMGGMADASTWTQMKDIFNRDSELYKKFVLRCGAVADVLGEFPDTVICLEAINEADFTSVVEGYWKPTFGTYANILEAFSTWQVNLINDIKSRRKTNGECLITNATAIDSSIYPIAWKSEITTPNIILKFWAGCDIPCIHTYINENYQNHWDVWMNEKIPAFVAAAKSLGRPLIIGETGQHWEGGTYNQTMDTLLWDTEIAEYFWMIRRWNPTEYETPQSWTDVGTLEAPVVEVVDNSPIVASPDGPVIKTYTMIDDAKIKLVLKSTDINGKNYKIYVVEAE